MNKKIVPFIDVLFSFILTLVAVFLLLKVTKSDADPALQQNVLFQVVLTWEGPTDLDLWSKDSKGHICGFKTREGGQGSLFSLNRDCLGANTTEVNELGEVVNKVNEELISIRGTFEGEYIVNVHSYNMKNSQGNVKAKVRLIKTKPYGIVIEREKEFTTNGEELTFFRFSVDKNDNITDINELPTSILQEHHDSQFSGPQQDSINGSQNVPEPPATPEPYNHPE